MMFIAGTIPDKDLPLVTGEAAIEDGFLIVDRHRINCTQGTAAMISAAIATTLRDTLVFEFILLYYEIPDKSIINQDYVLNFC